MIPNSDLDGMSRVELEDEISELELRLKHARSRLQDACEPTISNPSTDISRTDRMFFYYKSKNHGFTLNK